jgi:hypothetical protein
MPIEIRELNIKITVDNSTGSGGQTSGSGSAGASGAQPEETLVAAVVEKVLEIIRFRTER